VQLRQELANATNKRTQQQYNQSQNEAEGGNAMPMALQGDENLARQALERKKSFAETANTLKAIWTSKAVRLIP